jgi:hypothetical protein
MVVVGFTGFESMAVLLVIKGVDGLPPSPGHAQLLGESSTVDSVCPR